MAREVGKMKNMSAKLFLTIFVVALLFAGCNGWPRKSDRSRIQKVDATRDDQEKIKLLRKIDRKFEDPELHFQLGRLYQADGLLSKAELEYSRTLGFDPVHREAQAALVKVLLDSGQTDKAGFTAELYIDQASGSAAGSLKLGRAFQKQTLDDYALACYRQALVLAPNSAAIYKQMGYYYLAKGDKVQAADYLSQSFRLDPKQPEVAGELGRLGVKIQVPRKVDKNVKKLDKILNEPEKKK